MQSSSKQPVLRVALGLPLRQLFDYLPGNAPVVAKPGTRVLVPFGRRKMVGVVVEVADKSELPLEKLAIVEAYPDGEQLVLTGETLELLNWCWRYYKHAPGEVVFNALPPLLRKVEGVIPPLPVQYSLTAAGGKRLQEPPGRIKAQYLKVPQQIHSYASLLLPGARHSHVYWSRTGSSLKHSNPRN